MSESPPKLPGFEQMYAAGPYSKFPQELRAGGGSGVRLLMAEQEPHGITDPPVADVTLQVCLETDHKPFRWDVGDGWTEPVRFRRGDMLLAPSHTEVHFDIRGKHKLLAVCISASELGELLGSNEGRPLSVLDSVTGQGLFRNPRLFSAATNLWSEAAHADKSSDLMVDGLTRVIMGQLLRQAGMEPSQSSEKLSSALKSRLRAYVDEHLEARVVTKDLARLAGMSQSHFSRSFRESVGESPYQYVLRLRVERAQALLTADRTSIADVAHACGFSSQAHMTSVFRERVGMTPARFRGITDI